MGVGAVGAHDVEVASDHLESGVTEEVLEGEGVAAVAEVGDGEGVTKAVGVDVGRDASTFADALDGFAEDVAGHGAGVIGGADGEEGVGGDGVLEARSEVTPEGAGGAFAEIDDALFFVAALTFASDADGIGGEVEVFDLNVAQLLSADAGIEEDEDDGAVAVGGGAAVGGGGAGFPGARAIAGFEEGLDFLAGDGLDNGGFNGGGLDGADEVALDQVLLNGPGPESGEVSVDVVDGFGGEVDAAARGYAVGVGGVVVLEPSEEGDKLGAGDGGEGDVGGEVEE